MYQGTEGWHVDGNTVDVPHYFTIIHCISANRNGPTLLVPLREVVEMFTVEERYVKNYSPTYHDVSSLLFKYHIQFILFIMFFIDLTLKR